MRIVVVGAGLAGAVSARLLTDAGHNVEVFEARPHIGGNCHDAWQNGVLVHQYGPHCFHTDKKEIWDFVTRFSEFRDTAFAVVANTALGTIPVPFNNLSAEIVGDLSAAEIRDLIFVDYSEKQWGVPWNKIPTSITGRVPQQRIGTDCRYHLDRWQGIPAKGFTPMFAAMLDGIPCHLGCEAEAWRKAKRDHLVFTGSIDEYFKGIHGPLGYRSLHFDYQLEPKRRHFQINECNRFNPWTRSVDHSHWLDQDIKETIVAYEYPCEWEPGMVRMYPKPFAECQEVYKFYKKLAETEARVTFVGRLATYKYLDMDDVIAQVMLRINALLIGTPSSRETNAEAPNLA